MLKNILDNELIQQEEKFEKDKITLIYWCLITFFLVSSFNTFLYFFLGIDELTSKAMTSPFFLLQMYLISSLPMWSASVIILFAELNWFPNSLKHKKISPNVLNLNTVFFLLIGSCAIERFTSLAVTLIYEWNGDFPDYYAPVDIYYAMNTEINILTYFIILSSCQFLLYKFLIHLLEKYYEEENSMVSEI